MDIEPLSATLSDDEIGDLASMVDDFFRKFSPAPEGTVFERALKPRDFDWANTLDAFRNLALEGKLPRPFEVRLFEEVFGPDIATALAKKEGLNLWREIGALINLPRTNLTILDHSMVLRQDVITALNPRWAKETARSFGTSIRALRSREIAESIEAAMRETPEYMLAKQHGVDFSILRGSTFAGVEEPFIGAAESTYVGRFARRINPGIELSERVATVYLNQKRMKLFSRFVQEVEKSGQPLTDDVLDRLGETVNVLTGRAKFPAGLRPALPVLNAIFFSARLNLSRVKAPAMIAQSLLGGGNRTAGLAMAREMATFIGTGATILGAVKASGLAEVELDPRSTDFAKIKVGNTRVDPWGGFQPFVRYIAQAAARERKTEMGEFVPISVKDTVWRFLRNKFSPQAGIATKLITGETQLGEEVNVAEIDTWKDMAMESFIPLFIQDVKDAYREMGMKGIALAAPGVLGVNVLSYTSRAVEMAQAIEEDFAGGRLTGDYRRENGNAYIPLKLGDLTRQDREAFLELHPDLAQRLGESSQQILEGITERESGALIGKAIEEAGTRFDQLQTDVKRRRFSLDYEGRKQISDQIKDIMNDVRAQFALLPPREPEEAKSAADRAVEKYSAVARKHDPVTDEEWDAYEKALARALTPRELRLALSEFGAGDHPVERAWHEASDTLNPYYDFEGVPKAVDAHRDRTRMSSAVIDGTLWAMGRTSVVKTYSHRAAAVAAFYKLYGYRPNLQDVKVERGGGGMGLPSLPAIGVPKLPVLR